MDKEIISPEDSAKYKKIAEVVSEVFFYGNFIAETPNEKRLEKLLHEVNLWPTTEDDIVDRYAGKTVRF